MRTPRPIGSEGGPSQHGRLVENVMHFARTLRGAGLPVGPGRVIDAVNALRAVGVTNKADFYWTLHAVFVSRRDQRELFDQAFHLFWRNPELLQKMLSLMLPTIAGEEPEPPDVEEISRRLGDALAAERGQGPEPEEGEEKVEIDAALTWSDRELLQKTDFEKMSAEEFREARREVARLTLPLAEVRTRRFRPDRRRARADLRATLRAALRAGGDVIPLRFKRRLTRPPPLVVLCDISGSMSRYSRMALHFMHALTNDRDRVFSFLFGTRLDNVTRDLRHKDVDVALDKVSEHVEDWSGGTRIGRCLAEFNRLWSRRVLGQGAVVLFVSDGLDRDAASGLAREMERLHKSCRRLIWLNPLLRYDRFQPKSQGIRAILPHVDEFRPAHSLASLAELVAALNAPAPMRGTGMEKWREMAA
ncbi:MAG: VWA domain-containing protein [Alphaproteobacteria bacterium]|nr:VWA domain-containing protein [Alphaproteobacteria bacterium]